MAATDDMHGKDGPLRLSLIAAITRANGLGVNGTLPWRLPKEMAHFRKCTLSTAGAQGSEAINAVIMGRKTWQSIPEKFRPLRDRINVVISRTAGPEAEEALGITAANDTHLVTSLDAAIDLLRTTSYAGRLHRAFLIGGAQLYVQALKPAPLMRAQTTRRWLLDTLLITRIHEPAYDECDVFLPEFRAAEQIARDDGEQNGGAAAKDADKAHLWQRASPADFDAFLGEPVVHDVMEEKGARYTLQLWRYGGWQA